MHMFTCTHVEREKNNERDMHVMHARAESRWPPTSGVGEEMARHVAAEPAATRERRRMGRLGRGALGWRRRSSWRGSRGGGRLRGLGKILLGGGEAGGARGGRIRWRTATAARDSGERDWR
jgi:hypothetical protein